MSTSSRSPVGRAEPLARLLVSAISLVLRWAPRVLLVQLASLLAFFYSRSKRRQMRIVHQNLTEILHLEPGSAALRRMVRGVAYHQVISAMETVRGIYRPGSVEIAGLDELTTAVRAMESHDGGQLLITAHLGSWELMAMCMARAGGKRFHCLAKRSKLPAVTDFLAALRDRAGSGVLWVGGASLLRQMLGVLQRGEWLGFAMDQKPEALRGPVVEFLGRPTEFVAGPAALAIRTGSPVLAAYCVREGPYRYRVLCSPQLGPDHGESDELALTQRFASEIEAMIRRYPEQWPWSYRRWHFDRDGSRATRGCGEDAA